MCVTVNVCKYVNQWSILERNSLHLDMFFLLRHFFLLCDLHVLAGSAVCGPRSVLNQKWQRQPRPQNGLEWTINLWHMTHITLNVWRNVADDVDAGSMFSWGHGGHGRLGHGPACEAALRPTRISTNSDSIRFKFVACGEAHSASIDSLGQVWCWGAGSFGRCGHGEEADFLVPKVVASMIGKSCSQVALGVCHSLALTRGRIWSWGGFLYTGHGEDDDIEAARELDDDELKGHNIVEIAAGRFHSLALSSTGEVFSWGSGSLGRLGLGNSKAGDLKTSDEPTPVQIYIAGNPLLGWQKRESKKEEQRGFVGENAQLQLIACGGMHSAAIEKDGSCWFWGHGEYGQNASAQLEDLWKPTLLSAVDPISRVKIKVLSVALGMEHCLMISTSLELFSWGRNHRGQLGLGTTTDTSEPTFVAALAKASSVAAGEDHSAGITPGGEVYTWGNAECGKLGHGSSMIRSAMSFPKQINTEVRVKKVNCGPLHTALIGNNGELLTFGAGWFGRLGHGDMNNQYSPKLVERVLPDSGSELKESPRFLEVTCGSFHTCAVCENFLLWVCGRDYLVCESDHITSPLLFNKIEEPGAQNAEIVTIAAGANHTLCVTRSGNLWGWGDNSKGQLGLGAGSPEHALPTLISCKGWRCRDGETKKSEPTPMDSEAGNDAKTPTKSGKAKAKIVEIPELMGVACGYAHSMAVTDNGDVWAWGLQSGGRLALKTPFDGKSCPIPQKVHPSWKLEEKPPPGRWTDGVVGVGADGERRVSRKTQQQNRYAKSLLHQDQTFTCFCRFSVLLCSFLQGAGSSMATHRKTNDTSPPIAIPSHGLI